MGRLAIVFLCGCLEQGKDGVGDYTRRLAAELIRNGGSAFIIAINDGHVICSKPQQFPIPTEFQECDDLKVPVIRIARLTPWRRKVHLIQAVLDDQRPQWISLQYVPHAYSSKGIPLQLSFHLKSLSSNSRWHVMFHELWGAKETQRLLVRKVITRLQQLIVSTLNRTLPISVAHTSNEHWRHLLEGVDVASSVLPLFSNIPVANINHSARTSLLAGLDILEPDPKVVILTLFGSIRFDWASMGLVERVQEVLDRSAWNHAVFVSVGCAGGVGEVIWRGMEARASNTCHFLKLGLLPPEHISQILQLSDVGVAMNYYEHVGKSSCAASMLDHGLPLILPVGGTGIPDFGNGFSDNRFIPFDHNFETSFLSTTRNEPSDSVTQIAMALASSLCSS